MIEWLTLFVPPIVGAGTGSFISRWLKRTKRPDGDRPLPAGALSRHVADLEEWRDLAHDQLVEQDRKLNALRREIRTTRLLVDVLLVVVLITSAVYYLVQ